jgi:hypothetical protein
LRSGDTVDLQSPIAAVSYALIHFRVRAKADISDTCCVPVRVENDPQATLLCQGHAQLN